MVRVTDLSDFGAGVDDPADEPTGSEGRMDDAEISNQCRALKDNGERCENAVSYMAPGPLCGPHDRAEEVERIDEGEE